MMLEKFIVINSDARKIRLLSGQHRSKGRWEQLFPGFVGGKHVTISNDGPAGKILGCEQHCLKVGQKWGRKAGLQRWHDTVWWDFIASAETGVCFAFRCGFLASGTWEQNYSGKEQWSLHRAPTGAAKSWANGNSNCQSIRNDTTHKVQMVSKFLSANWSVHNVLHVPYCHC